MCSYDFALNHQFLEYPPITSSTTEKNHHPTITTPSLLLPTLRSSLLRPPPSLLPTRTPNTLTYHTHPDPTYKTFLTLIHGDPLALFQHLYYNPFHLPSLLDVISIVSKFPLSLDPLPGTTHSVMVALTLRVLVTFEMAPCTAAKGGINATGIYFAALEQLLIATLKSFPVSHVYPYYLLRHMLRVSSSQLGLTLWLDHIVANRSIDGAHEFYLEYTSAKEVASNPVPVNVMFTQALVSYLYTARVAKQKLGLSSSSTFLLSSHWSLKDPHSLLCAAIAAYPVFASRLFPLHATRLAGRTQSVNTDGVSQVYVHLCGEAWNSESDSKLKAFVDKAVEAVAGASTCKSEASAYISNVAYISNLEKH